MIQYLDEVQVITVDLGAGASKFLNLSAGVNNSCMVTITESRTNLWQAVAGDRFGDCHGHLSWPRNRSRPLF